MRQTCPAQHKPCLTAEPELQAHACAGALHKQRGAAAATPVLWSPKRRPHRCAVKPTEQALCPAEQVRRMAGLRGQTGSQERIEKERQMEKFTGRVWLLGDDIDTDIIMPTEYLAFKTIDEMKPYAFSPLPLSVRSWRRRSGRGTSLWREATSAAAPPGSRRRRW